MPPVPGAFDCNKVTGKATVTWTISNREGEPAFGVTVSEVSPEGSTPSRSEFSIGSGATETFTVVVGPGRDITAKVTVSFLQVGDEGSNPAVIHPDPVMVDCEANPTSSASVPPSKSASASPSLPVTGSNNVTYGAVAVALIAIGGVLFVMARRRRIRFEA